jgi:hypothetical protein
MQTGDMLQEQSVHPAFAVLAWPSLLSLLVCGQSAPCVSTLLCSLSLLA